MSCDANRRDAAGSGEVAILLSSRSPILAWSKEVRQPPLSTHAPELAFTLVEVMVALSIVAIGMLAAFSAVNQIVSDTTYLRNKTLADWIAMNHMTDIRLEGELPEIGESDGEVEFAEQEWRWEARVSETPVESMRRIDIDVALANEPDTVLITLSGFAGGALNLQTLSSPWLTGVPGPPAEGPDGPVPEVPDGG